jgi:hypothetical protein
MKKFLIILLVLGILSSLTGCAKCISEETKTVEVEVIDSYYKGMWIQPVFTGKVTTMITHPAIYKIYIEYEGVEYTIFGRDTYDKYSEKIGEKVNGILEIRKYDDGTVRNAIIALE